MRKWEVRFSSFHRHLLTNIFQLHCQFWVQSDKYSRGPARQETAVWRDRQTSVMSVLKCA